MKPNLKVFFAFLLFSLVPYYDSFGQVKLPQLVRDSMILQRDAKIKIWGWASPGEKLKISFNKKTYKAITNKDSNWSVFLPPMKAGGPYTMQIDASNHIQLKEILIGDLWLCSGQSNMVHQVGLHKERFAEEIIHANYPEIRHFLIPTQTDLLHPISNISRGAWKWANPNDVLEFSGVAYSFAKTIYEKYHVPIGLINSTFGGPGIEAWISEEGLKDFPSALATVNKNKDTASVNAINRAAYAANSSRPKIADKGLEEIKPWYDTSYIPKGWHTITIPGYWEDQGIKDLNGVVWYRKEINLPASVTGIPAKIYMGRIVDADFFYVNGERVGNTTYQYPQRKYDVPIGLLKPGKNIFTIRVINYSGKGGFVPDKPYYLVAGGEKIDLKGDWFYKVGAAFSPESNSSPQPISLEYQPTALFNGMIAPIVNYSIKGVLWYQGEGSLGNPSAYEKLLPALITDWRNKWKDEHLPFLFVQLPNFGDVQYLPSESGWAILREGQLKTLSVPNTGMAVAIDLGEWNDIHPDNKKDVGIRLALSAQKTAYGEKDIVYSGPLYKDSKIEGNKIIVTFTNTGGGLITNDGEELNHFAIAGADKKFIWGSAKIDGDKVLVWNDKISSPVYVRYAWADNPDGANLYNKEGLPASPFRTDK